MQRHVLEHHEVSYEELYVTPLGHIAGLRPADRFGLGGALVCILIGVLGVFGATLSCSGMLYREWKIFLWRSRMCVQVSMGWDSNPGCSSERSECFPGDPAFSYTSIDQEGSSISGLLEVVIELESNAAWPTKVIMCSRAR